MMSHFNEFAAGFALGASGALWILFAGFLVRLMMKEYGAGNRRVETGVHPGLIREVRARKRPPAASLATKTVTDTASAPLTVPARDTGSKVWTNPAKTVVLNYQWN